MSPAARTFLPAVPVVAAIVAIAAAAPTLGTDDANWQRLASFPRERRQLLYEKLREFETLDRPAQSAVRELDAKLAALPAGDRANYLAVLRRYHLWLDGLTEAQRDQIAGLSPEKRMAVVSRVAAERASRPRRGSPPVLGYSDFGDYSPYELADQVLIWQAATPAQKTELARLDEGQRTVRLQRIATEQIVAPVPRPVGVDEEATIKRAMKRGLSNFFAYKKIDERLKETKARRRMIDHLLFMESPPARVSAGNLSRFAKSLPPWIRALTDPLPPDEARRRLTVLYRLLYPPPTEFVEKKAVAAPGSPASAPSGGGGAAAPPKAAAPARPKTATGTAPF